MQKNAENYQMSRRSQRPDREGMILILVLIVIALMSLAGYTFTEMMLAEEEAAILHGRQIQAQALADSGAEAARLFLAQTPTAQQDAGGSYDNPNLFRGVLVADDAIPANRGRFSILAPLYQEGSPPGLRFGLEDESGRLNLNMLLEADKTIPGSGRTLLMGLPGMTEEIADSILDYMDEDDELREFGAESGEYTSLDPPYAPKNGPLETVEELLLVRGVTPYLLFGTDANRNGITDMHEAPVQASDQAAEDGSDTRGWSGYLTLYSMEGNLNSEGLPRIYLNGDDLEKLYNDVLAIGGPDWAAFIVAYRQFGPSTGTGQGTPIGGRKPDFNTKATKTIPNVLELIGAKVSGKLVGDNQATMLDSPFPSDTIAMNVYLPKLMDSFTATGQDRIPARININQAPRAILMGIPGMDAEIVDKIMAEREPVPAPERPQRRYETWIMSEGLVPLAAMKQMMPFVCGGGSVYRAQIVGYFDESGPSSRIEAVIDATNGAPRLLFWRNISHLGRGFPLETLGVQAL